MDSINRICFNLVSVKAVTMVTSGLPSRIIQNFRKVLKVTKYKLCVHFSFGLLYVVSGLFPLNEVQVLT